MPEQFTQIRDQCVGRFQLRFILRRGRLPIYQTERRITLTSSPTAIPTEPNLLSWLIPAEDSSALSWELECWDLEQQRFFYQMGNLRPGVYAPLFLSRSQNLYRLYSVLDESWLITSQRLLPLEAVLYQAESSAGVTRYLSIQEEALKKRPSQTSLDTMPLSWKRKELTTGQYLAGFYLYGEWTEKEAFWPLWVKAF